MFKSSRQTIIERSRSLLFFLKQLFILDKNVPELFAGGDNLEKGVQCYELFGGIALNNHTFSFSFHCCKTTLEMNEQISMQAYRKFKNDF